MIGGDGPPGPAYPDGLYLPEIRDYAALKRWLRDNLVTLSDIADRLHRGVSTPSRWIYRYKHTDDPFPAPVLDRMPTTGSETARGRRCWYWWPEVDDWLTRHDLPRPFRTSGLLTPRQQAVLDLADQEGQLTAADVTARMEVHINTARVVLGALERHGLLTASSGWPGRQGKVYRTAPPPFPPVGSLTPQHRAVLDLADQGGPLTANDVSARIKVSLTAARTTLRALKRPGLLTIIGGQPGQPNEVYGITPRGFYILARERRMP
jgi:ribosomal protein S25